MSCGVWVDDFVCTFSGTKIQREFERRMAAFFGKDRVTGGDEVDYVLGLRVGLRVGCGHRRGWHHREALRALRAHWR